MTLENKDINDLGKLVKDLENNQKKILQILDSYNDKDIHYSRRFNIYDNEVMNIKEEFEQIKKVLTFQNQEIKELHEVVNKNIEELHEVVNKNIEDIDKIFGQITEIKSIVKEINDREKEKEEAMKDILESDAKAIDDMYKEAKEKGLMCPDCNQYFNENKECDCKGKDPNLFKERYEKPKEDWEIQSERYNHPA